MQFTCRFAEVPSNCYRSSLPIFQFIITASNRQGGCMKTCFIDALTELQSGRFG